MALTINVNDYEKSSDNQLQTVIITAYINSVSSMKLHQLLVIDGTLSAHIFGTMPGTDDGGFANLTK